MSEMRSVQPCRSGHHVSHTVLLTDAGAESCLPPCEAFSWGRVCRHIKAAREEWRKELEWRYAANQAVFIDKEGDDR